MKKVKITEKNYHPIGSFFITENTESPSSLFGGTWEKLPEGYALWTASSGAGGTIEAGLPEIFGYINTRGYGGFDVFFDAGGAFLVDLAQKTNYQASTYQRDEEVKAASVGFWASKSNSIYGKSTTVQPPAYKAYIWKRVDRKSVV